MMRSKSSPPSAYSRSSTCENSSERRPKMPQMCGWLSERQMVTSRKTCARAHEDSSRTSATFAANMRGALLPQREQLTASPPSSRPL
eukprot:4872289-Pleurochrysis_carterae.AAC.2